MKLFGSKPLSHVKFSFFKHYYINLNKFQYNVEHKKEQDLTEILIM